MPSTAGMERKKLVVLGFAGLALLSAAVFWQPRVAHAAAQPQAQDKAGELAFYTQKVLPIFQANCYRCHGGMNHRGGLSIETKAGLLKGGHDGAVIVPGHPEQSLLVKLIRHEGPADDPMPMPPKSKISDADIATVSQWIKDGAVMPE